MDPFTRLQAVMGPRMDWRVVGLAQVAWEAPRKMELTRGSPVGTIP